MLRALVACLVCVDFFFLCACMFANFGIVLLKVCAFGAYGWRLDRCLGVGGVIVLWLHFVYFVIWRCCIRFSEESWSVLEV